MTTRILLVSELFPPAIGGSAALFGNIYGRLRDIPVTVLTDPGPSGGPAPPVFDSARQWVGISGGLRGVSSGAELAQVWSVSRAVRRVAAGQRPSIVHTARPLPEGLAALAGCAFPPSGLQYATWVHGEDLAAALTSREHGWLARQVCRRAARVFCNSRFTADLVSSVGTAPSRISVVYPGVDIERFHPDVDRGLRAVLAPAGPMLLSVGRLQRRKGHDLAIQAVGRIAASFPGLRYVIAGDGTERPRLEELVRSLGVAEQVVFLGEVEDTRLPLLYAACDVFLMPTRRDGADVEGFGIVYLEAAASGRPSIGGRNGGVPEAVADGQSGMLVSGEDPVELATTLEDLLRSDTLRQRLGAEGRRRVAETFTWARAAERVQEIHEEMTAG